MIGEGEGRTKEIIKIMSSLANSNIQHLIDDGKLEEVAYSINKSDHFSKSIHNLTHRGDNVYAANENGHTPLHLAAEKNDTSLLKALVNAGANVNARAKNGETPLHIAAKHGNKECLESLLSNRTEVTKNLEAVYKILKAAHDKINDAIQTNNKSKTLHALIVLQLLETIHPALTALADVGANIDARTKDGKTPVDIAHWRCKKFLIDNGADQTSARYG
nr:ankyrin repeat domain-containing protein [Endozoicomonas sp. ONNA2]